MVHYMEVNGNEIFIYQYLYILKYFLHLLLFLNKTQ